MKHTFQRTYHVLGSEGILTLIAEDQAAADTLFEDLWDQIAAFEARFSRFQADSELTRFNQRAGQQIPVSRAFIDLATTAKIMSHKTNGLYNPFVLPALQRAGYLGSWPEARKAQSGTDFRGRGIVPIDRLEIDDDWAKIPHGSALDFGGIGKGYVLDQLATYLTRQGANDYWLSLGGDIICNGYDGTGKPWVIGVQNIHRSEQSIADISNDGHIMAVATSGIAKRKGPGWHHIIDPHTGLPAETDIITATVQCKTGVQADIFAKSLILIGATGSEAFAAQHHIQQFVIQQENKNILWGIA